MTAMPQADLLGGRLDASGAAPAAGPPGSCTTGALRYRVAGEPGRVFQRQAEELLTLCVGAPYAGVAGGDVGEVLAQVRPGHAGALGRLGGEFAFACYQPRERALLLATDPFGSIPVYYAEVGGALAFGTDFGWVAGQAACTLDPQALYDYLFFSVVPGSRSIFKEVRKLPPASVLAWQDGRLRVNRYWTPDFRRDGVARGDLAAGTVQAISGAVERLAGLDSLGCFLSGGLDSSTVCGYAARHARRRVPAFTIGFDVPDYDESRYARISAAHFGLDLNEHRIRSADVTACIDRVIGAFPEPFGNASAVSAYLCAQFARDAGIRHLLAGDGGDELFAGNERYQKQLVFNVYGDLPGWLRRAAVDPLARATRSAPGPLHKLASYVGQAQVPLPDRLFSYNLLVRNDPLSVLTPEFLAGVNPDEPYEYARQVYREPPHGDALDRMLYLDWALTLTDNDLPKVRRACELAGVAVHFPMLDPAVVEASVRVPSADKLSLRELRKFYKEAFRDFLPAAVIGKSKHGFGVPVGIWINGDATLRERVQARLASLGRRGIVRQSFIDELLRRQQDEHAVYYGALMWSLFMLEEWLAAHPG